MSGGRERDVSPSSPPPCLRPAGRCLGGLKHKTGFNGFPPNRLATALSLSLALDCLLPASCTTLLQDILNGYVKYFLDK